MINSTDLTNHNDRLNNILDKISKTGMKSLEREEIIFLDSYSVGNEEEIHRILLDEEIRKTFISDDGNFTFKLDYIEQIDDIKYINGTIIVPDLVFKTRRIKGELKGSIIVFSDKNVAIDFHRGKYDIFEFVSGIEYELDCFIDDIILKIKDSE